MQKQDNKSTLTGLVLIGIIFVAYSIFFPLTPEENTSSEELNTTENVPVDAKENDIEIDKQDAKEVPSENKKEEIIDDLD